MKEIKEVIIPLRCHTINIHDYPNISSILVHGNNLNSVIITNFPRITSITLPKKHSTLSVDSTCVVTSIQLSINISRVFINYHYLYSIHFQEKLKLKKKLFR